MIRRSWGFGILGVYMNLANGRDGTCVVGQVSVTCQIELQALVVTRQRRVGKGMGMGKEATRIG